MQELRCVDCGLTESQLAEVDLEITTCADGYDGTVDICQDCLYYRTEDYLEQKFG